jgi:hypothetical protein
LIPQSIPNKQPLAAIPELDRIAADPRCLAGLSKSTIASLLMRSAVVQSALTAALATEDATERPAATSPPEKDHTLTAKEAAEMLRRQPSWIYRNVAHLPFVVKRTSRSPILCSEQGIRRYLARR